MGEGKKIAMLVEMEEARRRQFEEVAAEAGAEIRFAGENPPAGLLAEVEAVIGFPSRKLLPSCGKLEWLQLLSAGVEQYTVPGLLPPGALLTNATGAYGPTISEFMVAATLTLMKKLHLYRDQQFSGAWENRGQIGMVEGSRVLVVGMGDIGGHYARKMHALGARITGVRRRAGEEDKPDYAEALVSLEQLDSVLGEADVVSLSLPRNPHTDGLFSRECLARMKPGAILLNVGRGSAIDTEALCDALERGHLGGAALDVTDPEPLPPEHRLWRIPRALITPHCSGGNSGTASSMALDIALDNLRRYLSGQPLANRIDLSTGYRL